MREEKMELFVVNRARAADVQMPMDRDELVKVGGIASEQVIG
jgi:hypothetical protein